MEGLPCLGVAMMGSHDARRKRKQSPDSTFTSPNQSEREERVKARRRLSLQLIKLPQGEGVVGLKGEIPDYVKIGSQSTRNHFLLSGISPLILHHPDRQAQNHQWVEG